MPARIRETTKQEQKPSTLQHKQSAKERQNSWVQVAKGKKKTQQATLETSAWPQGVNIHDNEHQQCLEDGKEPAALVSWARTAKYAEQCRNLASLHGIRAKFAFVTTQEHMPSSNTLESQRRPTHISSGSSSSSQ